MGDLAENWSRLTLCDWEGPRCCLTKDERSLEFSIAAKFLTKRVLNVEIIARTFTALWRACKGFKVQDLDYDKSFSPLPIKRMLTKFF